MRALFVLRTSESKRLVAKAVANMSEVKRAREHDKILIGHGSTNVYVAEEILGKEEFSNLIQRDTYVSGLVIRGTLCTTSGEEKPPLLLLNRGVVEPPAETMREILMEFGADSVFIKGANAVDPEGNAAALTAHREGGTIGWAIGIILARGIRLVVPVGLEKLVPSVPKAIPLCGQMTFDYCQGLRVGLVPLSGATVITEIEAMNILTGVKCFHVASGGSGDSEGAVILVAEGDPTSIRKAIAMVESIKGEPPLKPQKATCLTCQLTSPAQIEEPKAKGASDCLYAGKREEDLPFYLKGRKSIL
jgi:hypothetical protein